MSKAPTDPASESTASRRRSRQIIEGSGLVTIVIGTAILDGQFSILIALTTAVVWWRLSTPLALATLTVGLVAVVPPVAPLVQFGTTISAVTILGVPGIAIAAGTALLTIGSWLAAGTEPPLADGWTLLPLAVGWLCVGGAVLADAPLWLVLAVCGGLTLLGANAITQVTDRRLSSPATTPARDETTE